ncbi:MerR family DNA-binding protein [Serratia sp. 1D1416]|uniref:MerR family DNA-binding protein n=1 Tax=Serratia sp. 1D1416 TaxID=2447890 RepID=UPI001013CC75
MKIIDNAQRAGFSLEQIRQFLPHAQENWDHEGLMQSLQTRVAEIERLQNQLQESKEGLMTMIADIANRPEGISCGDNMQRLIGLLRDPQLLSPSTKPAPAA